MIPRDHKQFSYVNDNGTNFCKERKKHRYNKKTL